MAFEKFRLLWKKGAILLVVVFAMNYLLTKLYMANISVQSFLDTIKTNQAVTLTLILSALLYPFLIGIVMDFINKKVVR